MTTDKLIDFIGHEIKRIEKQGDTWYIIPETYSYGGSGKTIKQALEKFVHNNKKVV